VEPIDLPLFPLAQGVLVPDMSLPLHIFEPRYREMVQECLRCDQRFGVVLIREAGGLVSNADGTEYDPFTPDAVASIKQNPNNLNGDIHASAEYRAHLVTVMAKRAVQAALG